MTEIDTGTAWHALEVDQVLDRLEVEPKKGLAAGHSRAGAPLELHPFVLRVTPLDGATWLRMAAIASSVILVSELHKLLRSEKRGRAGQTATTPQRAPARRGRQRSEPPG